MSGAVPLLKFTPSAQDPEILEMITVQREPLIAKLVEDALDIEGGARHRLLVGPRGMGKTHILALVANRVLATESDSVVVAWLEEDPWAIGTYEKFLAAIAARVAAERSDPELVEQAERLRATRDGDDLDGEQVLRDALGESRLVLLVENLDEIFRRIGESGQERFRAFVENWHRILILATAPQLFEGVQLHESPFYGFFAITHLEELSLDSATKLMRSVAELRSDRELVKFLGGDVARHRLAAVEALAGGHPRIWLLLSGCVSIEAIDELVPLFLEALDDLTPYYQDRLRELGDQQQELVVLLSEAGGALSNRALAERSGIAQNQIATMLRQLTDRGYVRRAEVSEELAIGDARMSFWELREPLMRLCLDVKQARGEPLRMVVEFLRAWYGPRLLDELAMLPPSAQLAATYAGEAFRTFEGQLPSEDLFRGTPEEILSRVELGLSLTPERLDLRVARASGLMMAGKLDEGREAFDGLAAGDQELTRFMLGFQLASAKEEALEERVAVDSLVEGLVSLAEEEVADAARQGLAAVGLTVLGHNAEALEIFPRALEREPESLSLIVPYGVSLGQAGCYEEALEAFTKAAALDSTDAWLHANRGSALRSLGREEEALAAFDEAVKLAPQNADFHREKGISLESLGSSEEALTLFAHAVELDPDDALSQLRLGINLMSRDRPEEALAAFERSTEFEPNEANLFGQTLVLRQLGRLTDAERTVRQVIELKGNTPILALTLGDIVVSQGDVESGLALLREALTIWSEAEGKTDGDTELICRILWDAGSERAARRELIGEVVSAYEELDAAEELGAGIVSSIAQMADSEVGFEEADSWVEDWLAARQIDDLEIPMRMLGAARDWKRDKNRSHLLDLPPEQREILTGLLMSS